MKKLLVAVLLLLAPACVTVPSSASEGGSGARSLVRVLSAENGVCSAVTLAPGLVLTADHCIAAATFTLRTGGPAGVPVARGDDRLDLGLLSYPADEAPCPCVRLADYEAQVDETVYVVGYPRGIAQVLTVGHSQGVHDNENLPYGRRLVTTATVSGGNSGGGVFVLRNGEFQLVGILVEMIGNLSFAVPLADIRPFIEHHIGSRA